jgi:hypothetical protein
MEVFDIFANKPGDGGIMVALSERREEGKYNIFTR